MDDPLSVHKVDDGDELPHVLGRLGLAEPLLRPDSLQELAAPEVLSHDVGVNFILVKQKKTMLINCVLNIDFPFQKSLDISIYFNIQKDCLRIKKNS